jgi:hypothetical protein
MPASCLSDHPPSQTRARYATTFVTAGTYVLSAADAGATIRAVVTATSASAASATTTVVT